MAKKKQKKVSARTPKHFLWSILFISLVAVLNIYFITISIAVNLIPVWPTAASLTSLITLFFVVNERKTGKLGKGKFLWSIFAAALTLGITLSMAGMTNFAFLPLIAALSSIIALILLCWEKYNY